MKNSTKRFLSFALASTVITGTTTTTAEAQANTNDTIQEEVVDNTITYVVEKGDTLGKISTQFYGTDQYYNYIAAFNNLKDADLIYPGQKIVIPRELAPIVDLEYSQEYEADDTYTVQTGDTLYGIVRVQYGLTNQEAVDKLATYNNLSDPNRIYEGQVLLIPCEDKLLLVEQYDYTDEYNRMGWILNNQSKPECIPNVPAQKCPCGKCKVLKP